MLCCSDGAHVQPVWCRVSTWWHGVGVGPTTTITSPAQAAEFLSSGWRTGGGCWALVGAGNEPEVVVLCGPGLTLSHLGSGRTGELPGCLACHGPVTRDLPASSSTSQHQAVSPHLQHTPTPALHQLCLDMATYHHTETKILLNFTDCCFWCLRLIVFFWSAVPQFSWPPPVTPPPPPSHHRIQYQLSPRPELY